MRMITVRNANERGHTQLSWLDSHHTFSFDQYYDAQNMAFGPLRVINEDRVAPGKGFGTHSHRDMEIITYVIEGELKHQDSLGTGSVIRPGEIQKMSAGSGIMHSEFNVSNENSVHFLQIWIVPDKHGIQPRYEQKSFNLAAGQLKLLGAPDRQGLISIQQKVNLYGLSAERGMSISHALKSGEDAWVQIVNGSCTVNGRELKAGDGAAITNESEIEIAAKRRSELLLFEISPS
jgi:quercetin 2,3-dioxygenase